MSPYNIAKLAIALAPQHTDVDELVAEVKEITNTELVLTTIQFRQFPKGMGYECTLTGQGTHLGFDIYIPKEQSLYKKYIKRRLEEIIEEYKTDGYILNPGYIKKYISYNYPDVTVDIIQLEKLYLFTCTGPSFDDTIVISFKTITLEDQFFERIT